VSIIQTIIGTNLTISGGGGGPIPTINVSNYTYAMNEGVSNSATVFYDNYPLTTIYWRIVDGTTSASDWDGGVTPGGSFNISGTGSTSFNWIAAADAATEGEQYYYLQVGTSLFGFDILNQYLVINDTSTAPVFTYDDFTIEWWDKTLSGDAYPRPWAIGLWPDHSIAISYEGGNDLHWINTNYTSTPQARIGQGWRHNAFVRHNGVVKGYVNGVQYYTTNSGNLAITSTIQPLYVGTGGANGDYTGYIKDLHIVKGYAKYTGNFTPPVLPITPVAGTVFLMNVNSDGTKYVDSSGAKSATVTGTVAYSADIPYIAAVPYSQFTNQTGQGGGTNFLTYAGPTYNTDLLNVKQGWIVSIGGNDVATVIANAVDNGGIIDIAVNVDLTSSMPAVVTFTQPNVGGSLYFDGASYINYGASVDWAIDVDDIPSGLTLDVDANNPSSYPGTGTTWIDLSGNSGMTLINSPAYSVGPPAYFDFNGSNQYATGSATGVLPLTNYTKIVWFRLDTLSANNNIVSSELGGHFMYFNNTDRLWAGHANVSPFSGPGAFGSTQTFNIDTWYFAAVTFSSTNGIKMYINGYLDASDPAFQTPHAGNGSVNIGCFGAGGNLLNGKVGRVLCFDRELTAGEVMDVFNATRNRYGI
jgi:hypothetical protein